MESIRALFICSRNEWRSPTAEHIYRNHQGLLTRSAGTSASARHRVNQRDLDWADLIFVMEQSHLTRLRAEFREDIARKKIHVLEIEDRYRFLDPELIAELRLTIDPILAEFSS